MRKLCLFMSSRILLQNRRSTFHLHAGILHFTLLYEYDASLPEAFKYHAYINLIGNGQNFVENVVILLRKRECEKDI